MLTYEEAQFQQKLVHNSLTNSELHYLAFNMHKI